MTLFAPQPLVPAPAVHHALTPTGVAVLLMLALVVDYMSIGPGSIRDRLAFFMALPAIRTGFGGGPLGQWTTDKLATAINGLKGTAGAAYIAGAATNVVIGAVVGIFTIYTIGVLLPVKSAKRLGSFAQLTWGDSGASRLNRKLWASAILLGILADVPQGLVGALLRGGIDFLSSWVGLLPTVLFGVS
jgi:hypothetical protein